MGKASKNKSEIFTLILNWEARSKKLQQKYDHLTDADLKFDTGKENESLNKVEKRLNKKQQEVLHIIKKGPPKES